MKFEKYFDKKQQRLCWRFDVTICRQRLRHGGFAKKSDAETALAAIRLEVEKRKYNIPRGLPGYTLNHLLKKLEEDETISPRRTCIFQQFVEFIGSEKPIVELRKVHLVDFLNHLRERELRDSSVGHYLNAVATFLNRAGFYFALLEDYQAPKFPPRPQGEPRQRILTKEELGKIFTAIVKRRSNEEARIYEIKLKVFDIARLMLLTGGRREHIENITPGRINYGWKTLTLRSEKVKREHTIGFGGLAREVLDQRIAKTSPGEGLFDGIENHHVSNIFKRIASETELSYGQRTSGGWTLHDFRRTAATVLENAGIPYSAVMAQLGHKRSDITAVYTPPQLETLQRAAAILENWCRDIDGIFWGTRGLQSSPETVCEQRKLANGQ